ncbi:hypothetical protein [Methanocaldococcus sp.]
MQNTSKRAKLYLYDILEAIEAIESYTKDIDYEEFANNRLIIVVCIRSWTYT